MWEQETMNSEGNSRRARAVSAWSVKGRRTLDRCGLCECIANTLSAGYRYFSTIAHFLVSVAVTIKRSKGKRLNDFPQSREKQRSKEQTIFLKHSFLRKFFREKTSADEFFQVFEISWKSFFEINLEKTLVTWTNSVTMENQEFNFFFECSMFLSLFFQATDKSMIYYGRGKRFVTFAHITRSSHARKFVTCASWNWIFYRCCYEWYSDERWWTFHSTPSQLAEHDKYK